MSNINITGNLNVGGEILGPTIDALKASGSKPMINLDNSESVDLNELTTTQSYYITLGTLALNKPTTDGGHATIFVNRGEEYENTSNNRTFCQLSQLWVGYNDNTQEIFYRAGYLETTDGANTTTWDDWKTSAGGGDKYYNHNISITDSNDNSKMFFSVISKVKSPFTSLKSFIETMTNKVNGTKLYFAPCGYGMSNTGENFKPLLYIDMYYYYSSNVDERYITYYYKSQYDTTSIGYTRLSAKSSATITDSVIEL